MGHFKPSEEQLERRASVGRWQIVRASFGTANEDLIIRHQLQTPDPEQVAYQSLNMTGPSNLYHDGSATRLAWGDGFVRLRSSVAPVVMDILLQVVAAPIGTTKLPMGGATIPGINADTLDGLDSTAFSRNAFKTIVIDGAGDVIADEPDDTLTLTAGPGIIFNSIPGDDEIEIEALAPVIDELDDIGDVDAAVPADGDVLTWDAASSSWIAAAGGGGGGGGGALVFLEEKVASASATLDFTNWYDTDYDDYVIEIVNIKNATNTTDLWMRVSTDAGATWITTTYYYSWIYTGNTGTSGVVSTGGGSAAQAVLMTAMDNGVINPGASGRVTIYKPGSTTTAKTGILDLYGGQSAAAFRVEGFWQNNGTAAVNGLRFLFSSGNITSGAIRIYGIAKTASGGGGGGASVLDDLTDVDVPAPADGDVLTWDSATSEWISAAPTGGSGSGGLVLLEQHTAAASATLDFTTAITSDYDDYLIELVNVLPATNSVDLLMRMSTNAGSSYDSSASYGNALASFRAGAGTMATQGAETGETRINLTAGLLVDSSTAWGGVRGSLNLFNPLSASAYKVVIGKTNYRYGSGGAYTIVSDLGCSYQSATAVNAFQFYFTSGNIASGTIRVYGIAKTVGGGGGGGASELDDLTDVDAAAPADGDVLTWDAASSEWIAAAPTGGGGGSGGGGWVLLEEHTAAASTELAFNTRNMTGSGATFQTDYDEYILLFENLIPATNNVSLYLQFSSTGGASYVTAGYRANFHYVGNTAAHGAGGVSTGAYTIADTQSSTSTKGTRAIVTIFNPTSTTNHKYALGDSINHSGGDGNVYRLGTGVELADTTAMNAFRLFYSSGNITSGTVRLYGVIKTAGGGGAVAELDDLSDVDTGTPADGDVLTWDSSAGEWVATAPTGGSGGSGGWTLVEEHVAAASSELLFTDWYSSDHDEYQIRITDYLPGTNATNFTMRFSTDGGTSYDSAANYSWASFAYVSFGTGVNGANGTTAITIFPSVEIDASWIGSAQLEFTNPGSAKYKSLVGSLNYRHTDRSGVDVMGTHWASSYNSTTAVNAIRFYVSSGTFSGTVRIYGITKTAAGETSSPGAVVQVQNYQTGAVTTGNTVIPHDDTIPQQTEGDQYMTLAITPTSATNKLKIDVVFMGSCANANWISVALFQDSTADALAAFTNYENIGTSARNSVFSHWMTAGTTSSTTFKVRAGRDASAAGPVTFNGAGGVRKFGGVMASSITITEIDPAGTGASGVLSDAVGQLDIANTTTETTLYTYSVPAGALGTSKGFAVNLIGDWLNNTGSSQDLRLRVKYGATTLHDETAASMPTATVRRAWVLNIQLGNTGTTNSQYATVSWLLSNAQAGAAGIGDAAVAMHLNHLGSGSATEDSTLVKALTVTMELSAASTNLSFRRQNGSLKEL